MRVSLVHNPSAGDESLSRKKLVKLLKGAGYDPVYYSTKGKNKDENYDRLVNDPGELVIAAGGDGTVRKVALRLIGSGVPIALLPLGTANNISRSLGVSGSPREVIAGWASSRRKSIDVGVVSSPWGEACFLEGVGLGLFGKGMSLLSTIDNEADPDFSSKEDKLYRDLSALIVLASEYHPVQARVIIDGQEFSDQYLILEAMNMNSVGPQLSLAPAADPGDGLLEIISVNEDGRDELKAYLTSLLEGEEKPPKVTVRQGRRLQIHWGGSELHIDDQLWPRREAHMATGDESVLLDISLRPQALEFLVGEPG